MSIHNMGMAGGFYGALVYTAPDGSQRFDREQVTRETSDDPVFGTVMTGDELQQWIDEEISRNQDKKTTLADLIKNSCPGWSTARFKYVGEAKTYSYYEFLEEMEKRSAASLNGEKGIPASGTIPVSEEKPVSKQQIALLFEDKESVSTDKTARERWEQSFHGIGLHAPESVKQAWLDAAETAGVDGMGVSKQGKLTHISQMMVQRCIRWQRGEDGSDMLGSSVQSAIRAAERALHDLEHPLDSGRSISPEKRQNMEKEKTFYLEFIKRLQETQNSSGKFAQQMSNAASTKTRGYKVYMKTDDMLYSGGNGSGLSFYIKYAEESTRENPAVIARGVDEHGKEFEQTIYINDINPRSATVVEMHALEAYLGVDKNGGLSSLPHDPFRGAMGLYDRADFIDLFQNSVRDMNTLGERKLADYYRYSLQMYLDFMREKGKNDSAPADGNNPFEHWQKHTQRAEKKPARSQESKSDSEIITQPDGSRTLMITTQVGDTETVMNIKLAGPSVFQGDYVKQDMLVTEDVRPDRLKNGEWESGENGNGR